MLILKRGGEFALAQRCVNPFFETIGSVDCSLFGAAGAELVMIASARWIVFDECARPEEAPMRPLLAATHHHRHCRGTIVVG